MRALIKLSFLLVLLGLLVVAGLYWLALADTPLVPRARDLSHQDIAHARSILRENDPRRLPPDTRHVLEIAPQDLELAATYLLRKVADGDVRLTPAAGRLAIEATASLPRLPGRRYLNLRARVSAYKGQPEIDQLAIGRLPIPRALAGLAVRKLLAQTFEPSQLHAATGLVEELQLLPDRLRLAYSWNNALIDRARDTLLTGDDREALRHYHDLLLATQAQGTGTRGSLTDLLLAMFSVAEERSRERDPVAENIALLTVLGTWAGGRDTRKLVPGSSRPPMGFRLTLQRRRDLAKHFLASAALAARGDTTLSDAIGLFKEIADTDGGSGFSFTDIAADRAGTRFGELASRSPDTARALQRRLAAGIAEADIMPPVRDLPEHMDADAFRARFGTVGSPAYLQQMKEIEQRIGACSLYRDA